MGWQDDLLALLQETGGNAANSAVGQSAPAQWLGEKAIGGLTSPPAQTFFSAMDAPRSLTFGAAGELHALSEGQGPIPWSQAQAQEGARISGIGQQDWGALGILKKPVEIGVNLALDPTTYLGFGAGTKVARGAEGAAILAREAGHPVVAGGLEAGARASRGAQFIWNDAGQRVLEGARVPAAITRNGEDILRLPLAGRELGVQPAFRKVAGGITRASPRALALSDPFVERQAEDAIWAWRTAQKAAGGITPAERPISSVFDTAAPPQAPHPHPAGSAPALNYQRGIRGWLTLHDRRLGIIPGMQGADYWRNPADVKLEPRHLEAMAEIGVAAMQSVSDEGGLFPSLMRATAGSRKMRNDIVGQFGPGIEPYIPAAEEAMRSKMVAQGMNPDLMMPASRHFLPHGWAKGVMSTRRLEAANRALQQGASREDLLAGMTRYPKSPQAVEAAAAHGASILSLARQGPEDAYTAFQKGGAYFPQGLEGSRSNARVLLPDQFGKDVWSGGGPLKIDLAQAGEALGVSQPFGSNRAAWDDLMRQRLPGIKDDELQTLADMSTDMLYHSYINAASPTSSGGVRGAEKIFRASTEGEGVFQGTAKKLPDIAKKISRAKGEPVGGLLPNLQELTSIYAQGVLMGSGTGVAKEYFPRAVKEIERIVGAGNYEDASILIHALALTSTASDVAHGVDKALRILAEWKFKSDATLRADYGLTGNDFDQILKGGLLHADFRGQQRRSIDNAFTQFAKLREGTQAITADVHGGPKTHGYAGSFLAPLWRDSIDQAMVGSPLKGKVREALDNALSVFAWDRHHNRIDRGATGVNSIEAFLNHERGIIAAKSMGLSPEEAQAGGWYWARNQQGLISQFRPDGDTAEALRSAMTSTWNHDPKAGEEWDALVARIGQEKGLTPAEAVDATYDLVRQDVFYRLVKKSLSQPEVQTALAKAGITPTLSGVKDEVLGIISRKSQGLAPDEWPQPMRDIHAPGGLAEQVFAAPPGTVLQFSDGTWKPRTGGFGVPIATGKAFTAGQVQTGRKALEGLLNRGVVRDLFDPSAGVDNTTRAGIGLVDDAEGNLRPAVFALTEDQARATQGAARSELRRVHDLGTGAGISVPGAVRNRHLPGLLEDIAGPATPLVRPTLDQARARGVTLSEMDTVNPISILQRKIVNPLMDAYASLSLKDGTERVTGKQLGSITDPTFPERATAASPTSWDWRLSDSDNAVANQTLKDGRTYRDFAHREEMTARSDMATLQQAGVTWEPYATLEDRLNQVKGGIQEKQLTKIIKDWHAKGVDPLHAGSPEDAATQALLTQRAKDAGRQLERQTNASLFKAAWGEVALLSPKYLTGNLQGNWIQNALAGVFMAPNWHEYAAAYKLAEGGLDETTRAQAMHSLGSFQEAQKWGISEPPAEMLRGGIRGLTSNTARSSPSAVGELVGRATRNQALARKIGTPFVVNNNVAQAIDTVGRDAIWRSALKSAMDGAMPGFDAEVNRVGRSIPGFEFSVQDGINVPQGGLFPEPLKQQFLDLGIKEGDAEHLTRMYVNLQSKGKAAAVKEMQRVQFSYDYTNLDQWVSKFVPFHYWYSRALRYYGEEAIRHPFLALNYMRASDGIQDAQNDPGLSARQKGFLSLLSTPLGFTLLMNPDSLFGVVKVFNMDDSYEADGQTSLGGALSWLKDRGIGLFPWFDGTLNLMGLYGNTFEPDLLGIRHKALVGSAINFVGAHTGFKPGAPYADAMGQLRYGVSSFVSSFTPDWVSQPVPPREGGSSQEASLDTIIEATIISDHPGMSNGDLLAIMTDPDSPEYKAAYQQAADAGVVQQLLNFTLPQSFRMRSDKKDQLAAEIGTTYEAAQAAGVSPYDFAPTAGDLAFKARYKAQTGHEWTPGSYEDAKVKYDLIRAPNEAKPFILDNAEYQHLGTPKEQRRFDTYFALRNGTDPRTAGLPEGSRKEIALEWADAHHATADVDQIFALRGSFESAHPEFQEFKSWQDRVRNLANLYGGNLAEYRRRASQQNPNAARYFQDSETFVKQTFPQEAWAAELDRATTSAAAFNAITGKGTNRQNPGPFPGVPPVDYTLPSMEPPAPPPSTQPYAQDWVRALNTNYASPVKFG